MRFILEDDTFFNENVSDFPPWIVMAVVGTKFVLDSCIISLENLGWPQRRKRRLTFGLNKVKVVARLQWSPFAGAFRRALCVRWTCFLVAGEDDFAEELRFAQHRPGSLFGKDVAKACEEEPDVDDDESLVDELKELKEKSEFVKAVDDNKIVKNQEAIRKKRFEGAVREKKLKEAEKSGYTEETIMLRRVVCLN